MCLWPFKLVAAAIDVDCSNKVLFWQLDVTFSQLVRKEERKEDKILLLKKREFFFKIKSRQSQWQHFVQITRCCLTFGADPG